MTNWIGLPPPGRGRRPDDMLAKARTPGMSLRLAVDVVDDLEAVAAMSPLGQHDLDRARVEAAAARAEAARRAHGDALDLAIGFVLIIGMRRASICSMKGSMYSKEAPSGPEIMTWNEPRSSCGVYSPGIVVNRK